MTLTRWLAFAVMALACAMAGEARAAPPPMRRVAVIVGANDPPPGRQPLRYAHDDARELASVLEQVGGFASSDVHVLLDPEPGALRAAFDDVARTVAETGNNVLFVFYYSGHSDGRSLFPHGEPVALSDLRDRVERLGARIRVGILDTCRGGSWTQSKGLDVGPPLDMADILNVDTEGTALVSSSSGLEAAHEASDLRGSFFTHYLTAGLRGAADRVGDGNVTLQEAFDYARERTVRDSARLATTPQHPSFDLTLRGRQDIVLSVLSSPTSALEVTAAIADLEIIQLPSGATVADAPSGTSALRIALAPGHYLVRSVVDGHVFTKDVEIHAGQTSTLNDTELDRTAPEALASKGPPPPQNHLSLWSPPADIRWLLHLGLGVGADAAPPANVDQGAGGQQSLSSFTVGYSLWYRITDRLSWNVPWPALAYRFGEPGEVEVMPYVGLASNGWNSVTRLSLGFVADAAARIWTVRDQWISLGAGLVMPVYETSGTGIFGASLGNFLEPFGRVGYGWTLKHVVTLRGDVGLDRNYAFGATGWQYDAEWLRLRAGIGVRVASHVGLDLSAGWSTELHAGLGSYEGFMIGTTIGF
jgi:hypothetical protein